MVFPVKTLKSVYHVGTMDFSKKRKDSMEGSGLSVSTCPDAWKKINPFTGGYTFELKKEGNQFLDFHALNERQISAICDWGVKNGYVTPCELYRVQYYDDEWETDICIDCISYEKALEEAPDEDCVSKISGYAPTELMAEKVMCDDVPLGCVLDLLSTLFAEEYLQIDGVWWQDELDVERLSAPRGVICNSKLPEWTAKII